MSRDMMANFELYQPDSVDNAVDLLGRFGEDGWAIAGGHDTLDWFKDRAKYAANVVDLTGIDELRGAGVLEQQLVRDRDDDATLRRSVELGEKHAATVNRLGEAAGLVEAVQSGGGIESQEYAL